jgi:CheY-like chemotaxis protein
MPKEKVLVVDDEEDLLELLRFNLSKEGYQVCCAASGGEALKSVRSELPDLILLDLMLPDIDGLGVARRLREDSDTRNIPIVMLTAVAAEPAMADGDHGGLLFLAIGRAAVARAMPDKRRWAEIRYPLDGKTDFPSAEGKTGDFPLSEACPAALLGSLETKNLSILVYSACHQEIIQISHFPSISGVKIL